MLARDLALDLSPSAMFEAAIGHAPDQWQREVLLSPSSRLLLLCSRQAGKSTTTAILALREALLKPGSLTLLLAPAWRQSSELLLKVTSAYNALGAPVATESATATAITFANGSRIIALPGESDRTIRTYSAVSLLVVDEASRVADQLVWSVRPMLAVSRGRFIGLTTPFGRRGWFYDSWIGAEAWHRVKVTWRDCARLDADFIEEERRTLPDLVFRSEYEVEFTDTEDQYFRSDDVEAMFDPTVRPLFERKVS